MTKPSTPKNFEEALSELGDIVRQMEDGQFTLEQSLEAYRRGSELLGFCQQALQHAEQQVRVLNEKNQIQQLTVPSDD